MRVQPKKSLGQNFLTDQNIRNKIVASLGLKPEDILLEIGAGRGELTELISQQVKAVYALEIDRRLQVGLKELSARCGNIQVFNRDILKFDLEEFIQENNIKGKIKAFGNIPYYISSPIIEHLLNFRGCLNAIFLTVQKEFGARVVAGPGTKDYGSFSCFVQYYSLPKVIFNISRNCFKPAPKVDSSFLKLEIREKAAVSVKDEEFFFKIIRAAFGQRRKTLRNSLSGLILEEDLKRFFEGSGVDKKVRPERLSLADFAFLANQQFLTKKA